VPPPENYQDKKAFFERVLTVYGRKAVLEVLHDSSLSCHAIHLAESNQEKGIIVEIRHLAEARNITVKHHSRLALSRISKNGKQDQGVAADIICPKFETLDHWLSTTNKHTEMRVLALDGITNPQNLGMIIRSAAAGDIDGIIWSTKGNAALGPLVIKASAGTLYRAPMLMCDDLTESLVRCKEHGMRICTLEAEAKNTLFNYQSTSSVVYVLGNETQGVSGAIRALSDVALSVPMRNGVESLNVAITASLIAFAQQLSP
jgi:23S rRNA (guanosine2251-2'-O)-methyltransferase